MILCIPAGLCGELPNPEDGTVVEIGLTDGSNAIYTCNRRYRLIGERIRTCMDNGMWSGQAPICLRMKITCAYVFIQVKQKTLIHVRI